MISGFCQLFALIVAASEKLSQLFFLLRFDWSEILQETNKKVVILFIEHQYENLN